MPTPIKVLSLSTSGKTEEKLLNDAALFDILGYNPALVGSGQIIVTSGVSFTTPSNITTSTVFEIHMVGAGGGGGASPAASGGKGSAGAGGAYLFKRLTGLSPSTTYTCAIGVGSAGSSGGVSASSGTATTLTINGTTYTANGGGGGFGGASSDGGLGGTAVNGDINITGGDGQDSGQNSALTLGSKGGDSPMGWGIGGKATRNSIAGVSGKGFGAGGSGGSGNALAGGTGTDGIIFARWFNQ